MILAEAERLHSRGWGILWLWDKTRHSDGTVFKGSKIPRFAGWGKGQRKTWDELQRTYQKGFGLGCELGAASPLPGGTFLACIDVDVKSQDPRDEAAAIAVVRARFPGVWESAPLVKTGYGWRLLVSTAKPATTEKHLGQSDGKCKVRMPSDELSPKQRDAYLKSGELTADEIKDGWRIRPRWEVDFMGVGTQIVLPPSVHPDTGRRYTWERPPGEGAPPLVTGHNSEKGQPDTNTGSGGVVPRKIKLVNPPNWEERLHPNVVAMIKDGDNAPDRSAALFGVMSAMLDAEFSDVEILSILTDKEYYLGLTGYHHAKTDKRGRAAKWLYEQNLVKAKRQRDPSHTFSEISPGDTPDAGAELSPEAAAAQADDLSGMSTDWVRRLKRKPGSKNNPNPPPEASVENTVLVLQNDERLGPTLFRRDLFAVRDSYGLDAPWPGGERGSPVTDDCIAHMTLYIGERYRFEPADHVLAKAVTIIATRNGYHPVRDELNALPAWDGKKRLDTWLAEHFGAQTPEAEDDDDVIKLAGSEYLGQVFRKWLVASVTRVFEPGEKFDWLPILQGAQGTGKSSFGSILFGETHYGDWLPPLAEKDAAQGLQGIRCHEFGELEALKRNEVETMKAFVVRKKDRFRPPYGRRSVESPRQCVFFGTTNRDVYLKDDTGNRRFMPIEVGRLDFAALRRDREQLWAEALYIYRNRLEKTFDLEGAAQAVARDSQRTKQIEDDSAFMERALRRWLDEGAPFPAGGDERGERFKLVTLFDDRGPLGSFRKSGLNIQFAAKALKAVGAEKFASKGQHWWRLAAENADDDFSDLY